MHHTQLNNTCTVFKHSYKLHTAIVTDILLSLRARTHTHTQVIQRVQNTGLHRINPGKKKNPVKTNNELPVLFSFSVFWLGNGLLFFSCLAYNVENSHLQQAEERHTQRPGAHFNMRIGYAHDEILTSLNI